MTNYLGWLGSLSIIVHENPKSPFYTSFTRTCDIMRAAVKKAALKTNMRSQYYSSTIQFKTIIFSCLAVKDSNPERA